MIGTCALIFIQSLIPACVFLFAGYLAGESGMAWLIAAVIYAVVQFLMLNAETVRRILAKIVVTILCECALQ